MNLDIEEFLLFLNQSISEIYIKTDFKGQIIDISDSIFTILGYNVNKLKTTSLYDVCVTPGVIINLNKDPSNKTFTVKEIPFLDINSNWVYFNLKALKKDDSYYYVLENINENILFREANKFSSERIKISEKRYKKLFNIVNTGIILFDPESNNVLDFNDNSLSILNYNNHNFSNLNINDLIDSDDLHQTIDVFNGTITELTTVIKFKTSTQQLIQAKVFVNRFNLGGNDVIEFIIEDLTPIIASEKEINEREKYLELITEIQAYFLWNNYSFNTSQELIEIIV